MPTATQTDTFGRSIEGARGTLVLGHGINAITVENVESVGNDYIIVIGVKGDTYAIPLANIIYFRYDEEV